MDFIVPVSEAERARGALDHGTAMAAYKSLHLHGCVLLRGLFAPELIAGLHEEFLARYGGRDLAAMQALAAEPAPNPIAEVGGARYEIVLRMNGVFGDPALFANPLLCGFLARMLGADMRLSGLTAVASWPGADAQRMHRDHGHLFAEPNLGPGLPPYAVNVSVPLMDVDLELGPTGIWPGSHRWPDNLTSPPTPMAAVPFQRGDAVLIDYRTGHAGLPNHGGRMRPIVYMVYARTWFFDEANHPERTPLDMTLTEFEALPQAVKPLLLRAYSQGLRARLIAREEQLA